MGSAAKVAVLGLWLTALASAQLPFDPERDRGQSVTGAFEGWFANPDGSFTMLVGYFNRNQKEELTIPIGPENRFEPGPADRGQPEHFLAGRQWGVFTFRVPADFGMQKLRWTLVANGKRTVVPLSLDPLWEVEPFRDATENTPPHLAFTPDGPYVNGPVGPQRREVASVGTPLALNIWAADDAKLPPGAPRPQLPPVTVAWSIFRGPGTATFSEKRPAILAAPMTKPANTNAGGKASTAVTFSAPGDYVLRVVANDWSGDGGHGFQCCWSNAQVFVSVK